MTREELRDKLDLGDYGENITDYDNGYICDIFSEIADGSTSIYYSDIIKYISGHVDEVNDAIAEFGWDGCGGDLYKAGQMAEYTSIERDLEEHIDDIIVYAALVSKFDGDIPDDAFDAVYDNVSNVDWNDRLDTAIEEALSVLDGEDEAEEEEEIKESKVKKVSESLSEDEDDEDDDGDYLAHEVYKGYDLYAWEDADFEGEIEYVTICKDDRVYSTTSSFERAKRMIDGGRIPTSLPPRVEPSWW